MIDLGDYRIIDLHPHMCDHGTRLHASAER